MVKYPLAYIRALVLLVFTALHISRLFIHSLFYKGDKESLGFSYRRIWAKRACRILGIDMKERQVHNHQGVGLYISNHRTFTDPLVQMAFFDSYVIAKSAVGNIPIIGKGAKMTGIILVDRENSKSRFWALTKTVELLKDGKSVLVYAEGTTTIEEQTGKFKIGTFKAAAKHGISVIPMAIEYRDRKDYWVADTLSEQIIGQIGAYRSYVKVRIGASITESNPAELLARTQGWIDDSLLDMQSGWSRVFKK